MQVFELECFSVLLPHVLALGETIEIVDEMHQLFVIFVVVKWNYGDPIVKLVPEGVDSVVNYYKVLQLSVGNNPQILDVYALLRLNAVLPVEAELDQRSVRVEVVQHYVSISPVTRSENHNLVVLVRLLEALYCIRPDVYARIHYVAIGESDTYYLITGIVFDVVNAMN